MKRHSDSYQEMRHTYSIFKGKLIDIHCQKYISYRQVIVNWIKYRHLQYQIIKDQEEIKRFKTSETIFVLGSGPSFNEITSKQWAEIGRHDSFGINFSASPL